MGIYKVEVYAPGCSEVYLTFETGDKIDENKISGKCKKISCIRIHDDGGGITIYASDSGGQWSQEIVRDLRGFSFISYYR